MSVRFVIFSPAYKDYRGGAIVMHKLCHLINQLGGEAYICPNFSQYEITQRDFIRPIYDMARAYIKNRREGYEVNPALNTPLFKGRVLETDIVIYPEGVFGNPLSSSNVVRWLLHKPGNFTNKIYYGQNELYFKFDHGLVDDFQFYNSKVSSTILNIIHFPHEIYNLDEVVEERYGVAYSIRKGSYKKLTHHPKDAVLIDDMPHKEVAKIFKRVKTFISYDAYSAYSSFAALCGCQSIVIPEDGVSKDEWYPDEKKRYGLAYGFDDIDFAQSTLALKKPYLLSVEEGSNQLVREFMAETLEYFQLV